MLSHTAGKHFFPATAASIPLTDAAELCVALAAMPPATTPGSVLVEHAATYGHLVDGLLAAAGAAPVAALTDRIAPVSGSTCISDARPPTRRASRPSRRSTPSGAPVCSITRCRAEA